MGRPENFPATEVRVSLDLTLRHPASEARIADLARMIAEDINYRFSAFSSVTPAPEGVEVMA